MRFILVLLLSLCVFTAHAQLKFDYDDLNSIKGWDEQTFSSADEEQQQTILGYLSKSLEYLKSYAQIKVSEFENNLKNAVKNTISQIKFLARSGLSRIESILYRAESRVDVKDSSAVACFDKYRPQLVQLVEKARSDIEGVVVNTIAEIYEIANKVQKNIDGVKEQISNLKNIYKKCVRPWSPVYTFKCLLRNVQEVQKSLKQIIWNTIEGLKIAIIKLREILKNVKAEIDTIIKKADEEGKIILEGIRNCVKNGLPTESPSTTENTTEEPSVEPSEPTEPTEQSELKLSNFFQQLY